MLLSPRRIHFACFCFSILRIAAAVEAITRVLLLLNRFTRAPAGDHVAGWAPARHP